MTKVVISRSDDIAVLRLDRPEALNAINGQTIADLNRALDDLETNDAVAFVLTGTGRAFCAGADLKEPGLDAPQRIADLHRLVLRLVEFPKISVAAMNGLAFGGGLELAMSCTLRVASAAATMSLPESRALKAMPGFGGTQLLPRLIGRAKALELLLTGATIDSAEAERIGLVNHTADDCLAAALELARAASVGGPVATRMIRKVVAEGCELSLAEGLALEAAGVAEIIRSGETGEAIRAFGQRNR